MIKRKIVLHGHTVTWSISASHIAELPQDNVTYILDQLADDVKSGELIVRYGKNNRKQARGWWEIPNWQDIANELRNALLTGSKKLQTSEIAAKALKRFDENWI